MIGQTTQDHLFVRGDYDDMGEMTTLDNTVSFKGGSPQTVWLWLDDDQIYLNEKVQALPKSLIRDGGAPYNEITYNSFMCDIYLPMSVQIIKSESYDGDEILFVQGDRLPSSAEFTLGEKDETKVIDGVTYRVYTLIVSNKHDNGTHFSARNATRYINNGALKKDDAPLIGIFLQNDNQMEAEGRLADMIIANQEFGLREPFIVEPKWGPNDYRFIYGTGGNNETQRFQLYQRVALYGSLGYGSENIYVNGIYLNSTYQSLNVNETFQLTATVTPENATNKKVVWKSSNPSVATVDNNGLVRAIAPGSATITATTADGSNLSASCVISVKNILATSIYLNASSLTLEIDETSQLIATVYPSNTTNKTVTWSSGNSAIARVSNTGVVTAVSPGTVYITATTTDGSNLSATCKVKVNERKATSISLNYTDLSLYVYQTAQLNATVYPSDVANKTVTWKTSNASIATVNNNGLVTAVSPGNVTITATTTDGSNLSAYCDVTVNIIPATSISLNKTSLDIDISDTYQLIATIIPSNATYKTINWYSSNTSVARVSSDGVITPIAPGNATITAATTDGTNLNASCHVTVVKRVKAIALNENNLTLTLPETVQLFAIITPNDATNQVLNWTSSNSAVARVDNNGYVTSVAAGTATIRAATTDGSNLSASCQITVRKQLVTSITLSETNRVMQIGETAQLWAIVAPENASNKTLTWRTSNSSVATVDDNGLVNAIGAGTATITVSTTDGSYLSENCVVEVVPDYYLSLDTLSHIRGAGTQVVDLPVSLINKNPISAIQFDVTLPSDVSLSLIDGVPDIYLDDARKTRSHSVSISQLSNGKYRVLVTSSSSKDLKGHEGPLVHMNLLLPQEHNTGNSYINVSNIIASESDETRHTLDNTSTMVRFFYLVGDADANAIVDIADHTATASKILGKSPSPFYYDAANVDANYSLDVVDLVGITNIALEIKPVTLRQSPRRNQTENRLFCDKLNPFSGGEQEIAVGVDCDFDYAGFQMDIVIPHGSEFLDARIGADASNFGLATEIISDGRIRILGTSFSDAEVSGYMPELLRLKVKTSNHFMTGPYIEFSEILFAERNLTAHTLDDLSIEYIESSSVYELMDGARIYVENGNIIVDTPLAGTVQIITVDGRMIEYQAHIGHNVYEVAGNTIYIVHFNGNTIKVRL